MTPADWGAIAAAIVLFLTAAASYIKSRTNSAKLDQTGAKLDIIGLSVDGNLSAAREEIRNLTAALVAAGIAVPPSPVAVTHSPLNPSPAADAIINPPIILRPPGLAP